MTRRLPFDPARMAAKGRPENRPARDVTVAGEAWSVSQLAERLGHAVHRAFPDTLRVVGEVSGFRERTHWYFDLKDAGASIPCVMFGSAWQRSKLSIRDGQMMVASGKLDYYAKQGRTTVIVESMRPAGDGTQDAAFQRLCAELRAAGWFSDARKRPLPTFPRRVAVITSRGGAALQDVLDTWRRRCPAIEVAVVDVRVQGEGAAAELAGAVRWCSDRAHAQRFDLTLLTRGGGSKDDLWAFNDRGLAEAIVESAIPVVAAIGHETDTTIAELVADLRAATPTQAAMRIGPDCRAIEEQVGMLGDQLSRAMVSAIETRSREVAHAQRHIAAATWARVVSAGRTLEGMAARLATRHPRATLQGHRSRVMAAARSLEEAVTRRVQRASTRELSRRLMAAESAVLRTAMARLEHVERRLQAVGPASVLARGYSIATREDGALVRSTQDVGAGQRMRTHVRDGIIESIVGSRRETGTTGGKSGDDDARAGMSEMAAATDDEAGIAPSSTPPAVLRKARPNGPGPASNRRTKSAPGPTLFDARGSQP